jgi:predicted nucleotidyltransferase
VTPEQQSLLDQLVTALRPDDRIGSAWLTGSLGAGRGDAWSDIDITLVVAAGDIQDLLGDLMRPDGPLPATALRLSQFGRLVNGTTPDLMRFDLVLVTPDEFARQDPAGVRLLFGDASQAPPQRPAPSQDPAAAARRIEGLVTEFLRILSLAPVAVGRREWVVMQDGVGHLRRLLIELMLEENDIGPAERGGAKKLYPFLTAEQIAELEALAPPRAVKAELIAANRDLRDRFLPRARRVAGERGAAWPADWEAAVMSGLARDLPELG